MTPFTETLRHLARLPGVTLAMTAGASDGLIVESGDAATFPSEQPLRKHTAALASFLYGRAGRASAAAGLGAPAFMRLEAERGQLCVVGCGDVVLLTLIESAANLGRIRLEMLTAGRGAE